MKRERERIKYLDILRAIAIILVVVGHIPYPGFSPTIHKFLYAFHIPLFFFVSGASMSFTQYQNLSFANLIKKRLTHIYAPFLFWGITLALPNLSLMTIPKLIYGTHQSIASVSNSSLWFLPVLLLSLVFLDGIFVFGSKKLAKNTNALWLVLCLLLAIALIMPTQAAIQSLLNGHNLPFGIEIVPMAMFFMLTGYLFQTKKATIKEKPAILLIFLTAALLSLTIWSSLQNDVNYVLMAEGRYGNYLYFLISSAAGIGASVSMSILIDRYTSRFSKLLQLIGSNTMMIFILHKYSLLLVNEAIALVMAAQIPSYIVAPIFLVFSLVMCLPISIFIKKHAPLLAGK